uniref:Uncharacterized protein n=1 Tax=Anguilla anguilla TaxID=7936 RepID=A0A0E9VB11_ANGAN
MLWKARLLSCICLISHAACFRVTRIEPAP